MKPLKKEIARQRRRIYGISFFSVITLVAIFESFFLSYLNLIPGFIYAVIGFAYCRKYMKFVKEYESEKNDTEAYFLLRKLSDQYAKRKINGIAILIAVFTMFIMSELKMNNSSILACPNLRATLAMDTPANSNNEACVWRSP